jgi:hypothetical protein
VCLDPLLDQLLVLARLLEVILVQRLKLVVGQLSGTLELTDRLLLQCVNVPEVLDQSNLTSLSSGS